MSEHEQQAIAPLRVTPLLIQEGDEICVRCMALSRLQEAGRVLAQLSQYAVGTKQRVKQRSS